MYFTNLQLFGGTAGRDCHDAGAVRSKAEKIFFIGVNFEDNTLDVTAPSCGSDHFVAGSVLIYNPSLTVLTAVFNDCSFSDGSVTGSLDPGTAAGAILLKEVSTVTFANSLFEDNIANSVSNAYCAMSGTTCAGGFFFSSTAAGADVTVTITNCRFNNNKGSHAGAGYVSTVRNGVHALNILSANFDTNSADFTGGALTIDSAVVSITGGNFISNSAGIVGPGFGGGIFASSLYSFSLFACSVIRSNVARDAGGFLFLQMGYTQDASIRLVTSIDSNQASTGNGGFIATVTAVAGVTGTLLIENCGTISANKAAIHGGLVHADVGVRVILRGIATLTSNMALAGNGGVVYANGRVDFENIQSIDTNRAVDGGVIYSSAVDQVSISGCTDISNNQATGNGGVVNAATVILGVIDNIQINTATNGGVAYTTSFLSLNTVGLVTTNSATSKGGAFYLALSGTILLTNVDGITSNTAAGDGGAIYMAVAGTVTIDTDGLINNNACTGTVCNGGFIYARGTLQISGAAWRIIQNSAADSGGAIYANQATVRLRGDLSSNLALVKNNGVSSRNGGAIYLQDSSLEVIQVAFEGNQAYLSGSHIYLSSTTSSVDLQDSSFLSGIASTSNYMIHLDSGFLSFHASGCAVSEKRSQLEAQVV
jgi:predicted outer membrane repeat protein